MTSPSGSDAVPVSPEPSAGAEVLEEPALAAATIAVEDERRGRRGLTIRLKLTLWYGCLFLLAGVLLIAINYFMVRNSLSVAPE